MGISFFITAPILLGISVYTVYNLLAVFFSASAAIRWLILFILIAISVGFVFSLSLFRTSDSYLVYLVYLILSLALGLLFYLTISGIIFKIIELFNFKIDLLLLSRIGVLVAVVLFIIGLFSAVFPKVKNISVSMAGLNDYWRGKTVVQISDVHLGGEHSLKFFSRQVDKINSLNPNLIVITGDLFDGNDSNLESFIPQLSRLKATDGVVFIPGNHDTYLGLEKIIPILTKSNITVLQDEAVTISGLEVIGLSLHKLTTDDNPTIINNLSAYNGQARILLKHVPLDITWAKNQHVGLQLSGHTHHGQMFPLNILTYLFYGKYEYGLHTDGDYNIYTSSGVGSWGPPVRTFNRAEIINITLN